ncbi:hypothetical protein SDC9_207534 [bioreactor metagenome]|uniref:Uncharacterized protein n=1 Tax=bioreactor metagenome TaxID=1076179 RepID=A0A645J9N2_9ZZZZ
MVINRNRQRFLRVVLIDHIIGKDARDLLWLWQFKLIRPVIGVVDGIGEFFLDDILTKLDTLVANIYIRPCNKPSYLILRFPAKGAFQLFCRIIFTHRPTPLTLLISLLYQ